MVDDLGREAREVHEKADAVLNFWFGLPPEEHFKKDEALDRTIAARFGAMREAVVKTNAAAWRDDAETLLAAIILIDQFSRNIHRGTADAFAADPLAQALTYAMIERGLDMGLSSERRVFAYMPLMHAELPKPQTLSLTKFASLGQHLEYAVAHKAVVDRFGRFPGRNAALGRQSTPEEMAYLSQPDAGW